ncbi:CotH kinase family protein [Akkermansiaceae bacterium]|nr:CotH kinase family protein [Akkermansiaceae bacterium]
MRASFFLTACLAYSLAEAAPTINSFTVSDGVTTSDTTLAVAPGTELTLTWEVVDAEAVIVVPGVGPTTLTGSAQVTFGSAPTTYFLNATGEGFAQASVTVTVDPSAVDPVLSEVLANANSDSLADEDGDQEDWVELRNPFIFEMAIGGYYLTDDPAMLTKWEIPAGAVIPAGRELVIFASGKDRRVAGQELHTNFKLNADIDQILLVKADGTEVVDQFSWSGEGSLPAGKSYGRWGDPERSGFFVTASPGGPNEVPFFTKGKVAFGTSSSAFTSDFDLTLASNDPLAEVRYTLDRSEPDENSILYTGPITISGSTMVRARLIGQDLIGDVSGRHYLKLSGDTIPVSDMAGAPNLEGFTSNLPIVVVDTIGTDGAIVDGFRSATFTVYEPENGVASLTSQPSLSSRAGYRVRGQSSAGFAKKQYRFELWNQEDEDKDQELLGMPSDSDFILGAPFVDKSFIRNSLAYELGRELGLEAPRTRHVEVFLNANGGELNYETDYLGVYFVGETNKITNDRIDLKKLDPTDDTEPQITGGYMMKWEQNVAEVSKRLAGFANLELVDPDGADEATAAQKQWISDYIQDADTRVKSANPGDPVTGYAPVIDVASYANIFVINELARDQDGYMRSAYMHKDRGGKLVQGPLWDYNLGMGTGCCRNNRNTSPTGTDSGWQYLENTPVSELKWERELAQDPDFWQAFVDRWQESRKGILDDEALHARMDMQSAPLHEAAVRNFAKWNNLGSTSFTFFFSPASSDYQGQIDFMKDWTTDRMAWIDSQMTNPPVVLPAGGIVSNGAIATIGGDQGIVYYTTDGSDPRELGGGINANAQMFIAVGLEDVPLVSREDQWSYLDDGSNQGSSDTAPWAQPGFDDSAWPSGRAPLGYSNGVTTTVSFGGDFMNRHITTYFRKKFTVTDVIALEELEMEIQYDDGALVYLNGALQGRFNMPNDTVGFDAVASSGQVGAEETAWIPLTLNPADLVEGENVIAIELHQESSTSSDLSFDFSLTARKPAGARPEIPITETTTLTARALDGDQWSSAAQQIYLVGTAASSENLVISEFNYHPSDPTVDEMNAGFTSAEDFEFIEFLNISAETIDLTGVHFTSGVDFTFPTGRLLAPGERVLVVRNNAAFQQRYPSVSASQMVGEFENETGLKNSGESLTVNAITGEVILVFEFDDNQPWPEAADGDGATLTLIDPYGGSNANSGTQWRLSHRGGTPGTTDAVSFSGGGEAALIRYATGETDPVIQMNVDGSVSLALTVNLLADDLDGEVQISNGLENWQNGESVFLPVTLTELGNGLGLLTLRAAAPLAGEKLFVRYYVTER